jgi:uncharacterized SAM-binding protein YcdF (DUF218 family)
MAENPYEATLETAVSGVPNRKWRRWIPCIALFASVCGYLIGAAVTAEGYGRGMDAFEVGATLPPNDRAIVDGLFYGGLGFMLLSFVSGVGSVLLLVLQLVHLFVVSRRIQ